MCLLLALDLHVPLYLSQPFCLISPTILLLIIVTENTHRRPDSLLDTPQFADLLAIDTVDNADNVTESGPQFPTPTLLSSRAAADDAKTRPFPLFDESQSIGIEALDIQTWSETRSRRHNPGQEKNNVLSICM